MPPDSLRHHGDRDTGSGLVDLAVNVRASAPPPWLRSCLVEEIDRLGRYPDQEAATAAVARRHGRVPGEVLVTHGAAEAFVLLARALRPRRAVVVHPQFTEPEAALRDAGRRVDRVVLAPPFALADAAVPDDADLVVVGNPTNPTSVLHAAADVRRLARPGRTLVVDEAFMDVVPGEPETLAGERDVPGLVVVRSLTKQFALAGLRAGYLLAAPGLVARLGHGRPLWPVSSLALAATARCMSDQALAASGHWARQTERARNDLVDRLTAVAGVRVQRPAAASFVLVHVPGGEAVRTDLRGRGFAVRRCDTFPGLGPDWLRVAVRSLDVHERFARALAECVSARAPGVPAGPQGAQCW